MKMKKIRSIGIIILGVYFIVYGSIGFLWKSLLSISFFYNQPFYHKILVLGMRHQYINELGLKVAYDMDNLFHSNLIEHHPILALIVFIFIPFMFFLFILSGIGILKLNEKWRKNTIVIYIIAQINFLVYKTYSFVFLTSVMSIGAVNGMTDKTTAIQSIQQHFQMLQYLLARSIFFTFLVTTIIIYFLTHPKVKELFK